MTDGANLKPFNEEQQNANNDGEGSDWDFSGIHQELLKHQKSLALKMTKYTQNMTSVPMDQPQRLTRIEARRVQRKLVSDWDSKALNEQDLDRQAFVKALFSH